MKVRYSRLCEALLGYEYSRFLMSIFMENLGNIQKAEAQGRRGFAAAKDRMKGLLSDAVPPGLEDKTESVELNRLDLAAHRYREAYESVRILIENQALIDNVVESVLSDSETITVGNIYLAWHAIHGASALHSTGLWNNVSRKLCIEINTRLKNQMFINAVTEGLDLDAKIYVKGNTAGTLNVADNIASLHTTGIWSQMSEESRGVISSHMGNPIFINALAKDVQSNLEAGIASVINNKAWSAIQNIATLHALGLWDNVEKERQHIIEKYIETSTFIDKMSEEARSAANAGARHGDTSFAWIAVLRAAALKPLAEYYEHRAAEFRRPQEVAAARKPQSGENASSMLPTRKF